MTFTFQQTKGGSLGAEISDLIRRAEDPALMEKIGTALANLTRRAFEEPALRPSPWPARKDKKEHPLMMLTGELSKSPRVDSWTASTVTVKSDRPYFAIHQFGGPVKTSHTGYRFDLDAAPKKSYFQMPARPMFPILPDGSLTPRGKEEVQTAVDVWFSGQN
jgi:phage gpG-like protein